MTEIPYSPGLEGVIATVTRVSYLDTDHERILVRGYDLIELARHRPYVDVAYLLFHGELPTSEQASAFERSLCEAAEVPEEAYRMLALLPRTTSVMDALRTGISFLAGYEDPAVLDDPSPEANRAKGLRLLAKAPTLAANAHRILHGQEPMRPDREAGFAGGFLKMILGDCPDPTALRVFDAVLTCYIEHEMPNSTFAARVIASTLSDLYGAVTGAAASLKGSLHGGANEAAMRMLLEILEQGGAARAEAYIMEKLKQGARIMGFGHRVYMRRHDPRAVLLQEYLPQLADRRPEGRELLATYRTVEEVMAREKGIYPNVDYPIGLLLYLLGVPMPLYTPIFLCARIAGLVAHVTEQHEDNRLFRPRVRYEGPPYRPVPVPSGI
ncbi:MAG: citrate synthase [Armatimonadetes bacterium]|nr:citrate synthase [Armatimonadota bacterium]MDW8152774.1 citrate/2-methylcitrate synthase [Armatimonadota bacterium]